MHEADLPVCLYGLVVAASVPFHRLPALHARVQEHLHCIETGYARFNRHYLDALPHPRAIVPSNLDAN